MLVCADIGGTHTKVAVVPRDEPSRVLALDSHASREIPDLGAAVGELLRRGPWTAEAICLGVAGPITGTRVETTNLPWLIDADALGARLGVPVFLLNDLEALAYGVPMLREEASVVLNPGRAVPTGTIAVIAAGTGLGEAGLVWDGRRHLAIASEGGHADFAPRNEREIALLRHLLGRWSHVSWERVVAGPGIAVLFEFLRDVEHADVPASLATALGTGDASAAISTAALAGGPPIATATLDLYVELYGAEAGNLALKLKATGGVWVGGGVAPKILPKLRDGRFREAFVAKGRFRELLEGIPVRVIVDEHTALYGAACWAADRLAAR